MTDPWATRVDAKPPRQGLSPTMVAVIASNSESIRSSEMPSMALEPLEVRFCCSIIPATACAPCFSGNASSSSFSMTIATARAERLRSCAAFEPEISPDIDVRERDGEPSARNAR